MASRPRRRSSANARKLKQAQVAAAQASILKRSGPQGDPSYFRTARSMQAGASIDTSKPYASHAVVYRAVSTIARTLASVPLRLYTGTAANKTEVTEGQWYDLFLKPAPHLNRKTLVEHIALFMSLPPGECLLVLEGEGDNIIGPDEVPTEIWPISGSCAQEILSNDRMTLEGWRITTEGGTLELPAHAVVQVKYANPYNRYRGLSPLNAALGGIRQDAQAQQYNESYFVNNAQPGGVVSFPVEADLGPEDRQDYRRQIEDRHMGAGKAFRVMVLGSGGRFDATASTHKDMEFLAQRNFNKAEIAMALGVHPFFLGESDLNFASAQQAKRMLYETTVIPLAGIIEDALEADLFDSRTSPEAKADARVDGGRYLWAEFDWSGVEALRRELTDLVAVAERLQRLSYPLNEINDRLNLGMPHQPHGDDPLIAAGLLPVDSLGDNPFAAGMGALGGMALGTGPGSRPPLALPIPLDAPKELDKDNASNEERPNRAQTRMLGRIRRGRIWQGMAYRALDPAEGQFNSALRGYFRRRRAEVLELIRKIDRGVDGDRLSRLLDQLQERWDEQLTERLEPIYRSNVEAAVGTLESQLGGLAHVSAADPQVLEFLRQKQIKVLGINRTIEEALRGQLLEGIGTGETTTELQDRVRSVMNVANSRARTIARTEASQTTNGARHVAMTAEGIEKTEWITSRDTHVRDSHEHLDGDTQALGESFIPGITLRHPSDVLAPARESINCRCVSAPVID